MNIRLIFHDLHFYHNNIIKSVDRPFKNSDEMNSVLIKKWNDKINFDDDIYILGDFTMKGPEMATDILYKLKGKKHLIKGNHDYFVEKKAFDKSLFVSVKDYEEIKYKNIEFVLCHYPFLEWNGYYRGAISLHGHQHNQRKYNLENLKKGILRYDVGVDANNMEPVSVEEILAFFARIIV